jgi:ribosomal RNA-processing protein 1
MEKFLYLVRTYVFATFNYLKREQWETTTTEAHLRLLEAVPMNLRESTIPNGLRYHMIDIYIDELDKVDRPRSSILSIDTMLRPLRNLSSESPTKTVRQRAKEALEDARVIEWGNTSTELSEAGNGEGGENAKQGELQC